MKELSDRWALTTALSPELDIAELEERLEAEALAGLAHDSVCIWFVCTDVCPPNGPGLSSCDENCG